MPYHPPLKIGSVEPFWPKIGHWEKMRYLFKMISTRPFPINLALIHPRHNPEGPWHPPDTYQTPNRHPQTPPDTPKHRRFYALEVTGRTMQYLSVMTKPQDSAAYWRAQICIDWAKRDSTVQYFQSDKGTKLSWSSSNLPSVRSSSSSSCTFLTSFLLVNVKLQHIKLIVYI